MEETAKTGSVSCSNESILELKGSVCFDNVVKIWQHGVDLINTLPEVKVDLSGVVDCDSSALALLTAWVRAAKSQNKQIVFYNMPQFLSDIGRVSGLDTVLPVVNHK